MEWLQRSLHWFLRWVRKPPRPGPIYIYQENLMANRFRIHVGLPPLAEGEVGEVTSRELTRIINAGEPVVQELPADRAEATFLASQGDEVQLSLRNRDDAGNVGDASERSFTVVDDIPPGAPGEMLITKEEVPDGTVE